MTAPSSPVIRVATVKDCDAIGRVHVAAWRETYRGLIPNRILDSLSEVERAAQWRSGLLRGTKGPIVFVAEAADGSMIGFGAAGPARHPALGCDSEITALYVLRSAQENSIGSGLLQYLARALEDRGRGSMGLWVLTANDAARAFYERLGGSAGATRVDQSDGWSCHETAYAWADLKIRAME